MNESSSLNFFKLNINKIHAFIELKVPISAKIFMKRKKINLLIAYPNYIAHVYYYVNMACSLYSYLKKFLYFQSNFIHKKHYI